MDRTEEAAARLRRRYPRALVPRPVLVGAVGLLALVGLVWLIWAASAYSQPPVVADVSTFTVPSERRIDVVLRVQRRDPAQAVTCRVQAQAADRQPVGEQVVTLPPATERLVELKVSLTTLRRAVAASAKGCAVV